jgi:membrane-associated phospholipid phosphatase
MAELKRGIQRAPGMPDSSKPGHNSLRERLFPPWTWAVNAPLLALAVTAALAVAVLAIVVVMHPYLAVDASLDREVQATDWGPLALTFPFFTWLGGPGGIYMQAVVALLVLLLNRRAWMLALAAFVGGLWYEVIVHLVNRPRPTASQILRVTEHPGSTSFPSGHLIFITISAAVLMLCIGHKYLPRWARPIGWAVVAGLVLTAGVDRIYGGAHWPSDVLAGVLIATAWMSLVVSVRWISGRALNPDDGNQSAGLP